jgi:hypothetical protein
MKLKWSARSQLLATLVLPMVLEDTKCSSTGVAADRPARRHSWSQYVFHVIERDRSLPAEHGWRNAVVEWSGRVADLDHAHDHTLVEIIANPSLVGAEPQWDSFEVHPRIKSYLKRGHKSELSERDFDVLLRVARGSADSSHNNIAGVIIGQQLYFRGNVVPHGIIASWPAMFDVKEFSSTIEGMQQAKLHPARKAMREHARQEHRQQAKQREEELHRWASQPRGWLDGLWPSDSNCVGSCETGRGLETSPEGEIYHGDWQHHERHGYGLRKWPDGTAYEGQYAYGARSGFGRYVWPDGTQYEGQWDDHMRDGFGVHEFADGTRYEGEWRQGTMDGYGKYTVKDDNRPALAWWYEGMFISDEMNGNGVKKMPDADGGGRYEGAWEDGSRNGFGTMFWPDGRRYEGEWVDDLENGNGTLQKVLDESYHGEWDSGLFHGHGVYHYRDGSQYIGQWRDGLRSGFGSFQWPGGEVYEGEWAENERSGRGKYTWPDGRRFEGGYLGDTRSGHGFMTWPEGTRYEVSIQHRGFGWPDE